jgi:DNA-binding response OmpR family regulator
MSPKDEGMNPAQILLIEDDQDMADIMTCFLQLEGFMVHWVDSKAYALQILTEGPLGVPELKPDLIVLDLWLDDENGVDVVREMRDNGAIIPPILIASADTDDAIRNAANELGARYLRKPFLREQLLHNVHQLLPASAA